MRGWLRGWLGGLACERFGGIGRNSAEHGWGRGGEESGLARSRGKAGDFGGRGAEAGGGEACGLAAESGQEADALAGVVSAAADVFLSAGAGLAIAVQIAEGEADEAGERLDHFGGVGFGKELGSSAVGMVNLRESFLLSWPRKPGAEGDQGHVGLLSDDGDELFRITETFEEFIARDGWFGTRGWVDGAGCFALHSAPREWKMCPPTHGAKEQLLRAQNGPSAIRLFVKR